MNLETRKEFVEELERQLLGPAGGEEEMVRGRPFWRYLAGTLFPGEAESVREDAEGEAGSSSGDDSDPAVSAAYDRLPSSMGISFLVQEARRLRVSVEAARYRPVDSAEGADASEEGPRDSRRNDPRDLWKRQPLGSRDRPLETYVNVPPPGQKSMEAVSVLSGAAELVAIFRPRGSGHLTTLTLINRTVPTGDTSRDAIEASLFQCRFTVEPVDGVIVPYPRSESGHRHEEDEELHFVYRRRRSYGIGHGCAATWEATKATGEGVATLCADPLPRIEVMGMTNQARAENADDKALRIGWLADEAISPAELRTELERFVDHYADWVEAQAGIQSSLGERDGEAGERIVGKQRIAVRRMRDGIDLLTSGRGMSLPSFRLAQRAILGQFIWRDRQEGGPFDLGSGAAGDSDEWLAGPIESRHRWHPFQLAFQLLVLKSLVGEGDPERDLVDLLWFPTGGGKTEAYLAVAATEMFHRRLHYHDAGTAVVMRYTLRLLTSQQFERCAGLVSAMETLRRSREEDLGDSPFRLGLWVGDGLTPNRLDRDSEYFPGAKQRLEIMLNVQEPENPFLLNACPRCGTRLVPRTAGTGAEYGFEVSASHFRAYCPDTYCSLHQCIPVSVVDDDLYTQPPTFVIGTIDKFARLAWDARPRVMFGTKDASRLPPSLVVQDELHLITGPLGTIAGVYEAGFETVIKQAGVRPKYIASTATIQRADEQCRSLYGRPAFVFPPTGLDADDSFFSRIDKETPGRTFVGVMGTGPYSSLTTLVQVSAAAAFAANRVSSTRAIDRDAYWTQVIYHNSRQELGKTTTMLRDDVKTRLAMLQDEIPEEERREFETIEELSANLKGGEVGRALERLGIGFPDPNVVDAVACTNMLSVGVDVSRLGLMIMKSQPKTTAEYIQSTSRVGRDPMRRPPGVVVTLYSPYRPRDRSHFEAFQSFHNALYKAVEPSSVTPYSAPARDRTLHAALVIALRMGMGWEEGRDASNFDPAAAEQRGIIEDLRDRIARACSRDMLEETLHHFDRLSDEWQDEMARARSAGVPLTFDPMPAMRALLDQFPESRAGGRWPTLNSMRHVDGETPFAVRGAV